MLVIGGTHSGCGKSTVTLGLLSALMKLGHAVQPFKCGPDFIDAGLHAMVAGRPSRNLDTWMCGDQYVLDSVKRHTAGAGLAVIEGVMGLFDGGQRSTAGLARLLRANMVLVIDAYGMAESAGAIAGGFCAYDGCAVIKGVIFNRVSSRGHYERLKSSLRGIECLGYLPRRGAYSIPSRHLGLTVAEEDPISETGLNKLTDAVIENIDMGKIAELARVDNPPVPALPAGTVNPPVCRPAAAAGAEVRIAVARDKAFCFYYEDNLDMLQEAGARMLPFSPLSDESLPEGTDAVYLGGGYPEIYAEALSGNKKMLEAVKNWATAGGPVFAECGGFMYLGRGIRQGESFYPLCGVFPINTALMEKPVLGYREAALSSGCILGEKGNKLRGHEFHYSRVEKVESEEKPEVRFNVMGEAPGTETISSALCKNTLGGYTHFHFGSDPQTAVRMVEYIRKRQKAAATAGTDGGR